MSLSKDWKELTWIQHAYDRKSGCAICDGPRQVNSVFCLAHKSDWEAAVDTPGLPIWALRKRIAVLMKRIPV